MTNTLSPLLKDAQLAFQKSDYNLALGNLYKASKIANNPLEVSSLLKEVQQKMLSTKQIPKAFNLPQLNSPWNLSPSLLVLCLLLFLFKALVSVYKKNTLTFKYWISLIVFSSFCVVATKKQYRFYFQPQAISLNPKLSLHLTPNLSSPVLFTLSSVRLLKINKLTTDWALVQDQGQAGWVRKKFLFFTNFHSLDILWEL
ncbi:MAG: hypothetical protein HAW63_00910 [Bdellovibrionaceae bacterium]|nr:hypothetical protein [Pseudobdellovibrionaceae bacterium]